MSSHSSGLFFIALEWFSQEGNLAIVVWDISTDSGYVFGLDEILIEHLVVFHASCKKRWIRSHEPWRILSSARLRNFSGPFGVRWSSWTHPHLKIEMTLSIVCKVQWKFNLWRKQKALVNVVNRSVKIFSFQRVSINIVLAVHNVEVLHKATFHIILKVFFYWFWVHWGSLFPVVLRLSLKIVVSSLAVTWNFVDILKLISILLISTSFVEIFLILSVVSVIIFTVSHIGTIVPWWVVLHVVYSSWRPRRCMRPRISPKAYSLIIFPVKIACLVHLSLRLLIIFCIVNFLLLVLLLLAVIHF